PFEAVTSERNRKPSSPPTSVYWFPDWPAMYVQFAPAASQRFHLYAKPVGLFDQPPSLVVSVCPTTAWPETAGSAALAGGDPGGGAPVAGRSGAASSAQSHGPLPSGVQLIVTGEEA